MWSEISYVFRVEKGFTAWFPPAVEEALLDQSTEGTQTLTTITAGVEQSAAVWRWGCLMVC